MFPLPLHCNFHNLLFSTPLPPSEFWAAAARIKRPASIHSFGLRRCATTATLGERALSGLCLARGTPTTAQLMPRLFRLDSEKYGKDTEEAKTACKESDQSGPGSGPGCIPKNCAGACPRNNAYACLVAGTATFLFITAAAATLCRR